MWEGSEGIICGVCGEGDGDFVASEDGAVFAYAVDEFRVRFVELGGWECEKVTDGAGDGCRFGVRSFAYDAVEQCVDVYGFSDKPPDFLFVVGCEGCDADVVDSLR